MTKRILISDGKTITTAVMAMLGGLGCEISKPQRAGFKAFVKAENDLKVKVKKPVNGYQAKQRKRKLKKKEVVHD